MNRKNTLLSLLLMLGIINLSAQTTVSGKLIDRSNGDPLIGASVSEPGTNNKTITDIDGVFSIQIKGDQIEISYGGTPELYYVDKYHSEDLVIRFPQFFQTIAPVEVLGTYTPQSNSGIPAVSQLTKAQLQINNEVAITPSLNLIPGVLMHSGALNTNRITIRGIGNRSPFATAKIRAYLDEIPLTNGVGETTIEDIDLSFVEQVAVLKGPAASLYGAGLGGVIQLSTAQSKYKVKDQIQLGTTHGSYGLSRQTAQLDFGEPQKFQMHLNFNRTHSDGYRANNEYDRSSFVAYGKFYP
ncbi:MAG: TonB-dependent receptor plug domain-containing protein, partial [Bacteroidota bacterium]